MAVCVRENPSVLRWMVAKTKSYCQYVQENVKRQRCNIMNRKHLFATINSCTVLLMGWQIQLWKKQRTYQLLISSELHMWVLLRQLLPVLRKVMNRLMNLWKALHPALRTSSRPYKELEAQVSLYRSPDLNKPPLEISANKHQQLLQYILSHSGLKKS